jgi:putative phosphoesterase
VKVAALYDVHGNLPALEAVLAEVPDDVDVIVFGGDVISGPWPHETLARVRALEAPVFVRGNTERLVRESAGEEHQWVRERLSDDELAWLRRWPLTASLNVDGLADVLFCHATPRNDEEILGPSSPEADWFAALDGVSERVVVCGHTHLSFDVTLAGRRVVNPGSVGAPTVEAAAWWAILGPDVELRRTRYDVAAMVSAARARGYPDRGHAAKLLAPPTREEVLAAIDEARR